MDDEIVAEIARVLCEVLRANETLEGSERNPARANAGPLTPFDGPRAPSYPIDRYLQRIHRYTYCGSTCLLAALIYIDRAAMRQPDLKITSRNIHRLLITSVVLSMKFWSDQFFDNDYYARVGGIPSRELSSLEIWLLRLLDFDLVIDDVVYDGYRAMLASRCKAAAATMAPASSISCPIGIPGVSGMSAASIVAQSASPCARIAAHVPQASLNMPVGSVPAARGVPIIMTFDALAGCNADGPSPSPSTSPMRYCLSRRGVSPTGVSPPPVMS